MAKLIVAPLAGPRGVREKDVALSQNSRPVERCYAKRSASTGVPESQ